MTIREQPLTPDIEAKLAGDKKGYFNGAWSSTVGWAIGSRVREQAW